MDTVLECDPSSSKNSELIKFLPQSTLALIESERKTLRTVDPLASLEVDRSEFELRKYHSYEEFRLSRLNRKEDRSLLTPVARSRKWPNNGNIEDALQVLDANNWKNLEDFLDPWGWQQVTIVHIAAYRGDTGILERAVTLYANRSTFFPIVGSSKEITPLYAMDKFDRCALHYAALQDNSKVVSWILEKWKAHHSTLHPQLSLEDVFGRTPLHDAAGGLHAEVMKLLIDAGAAPNAPNRKGVPPFLPTEFDAALITHDANRLAQYEKCVNIFINAGVQVNCGHPETDWTMLHHAASLGSRKATQRLLEHEADPGHKAMKSKAVTPLHVAAASGHYGPLCILLQHLRRTLIDTPTEDGLSPLQFAASTGHIECVRALVDKGANLARTYPNSYRTVIDDLRISVCNKDVMAFFSDLLNAQICSKECQKDLATLKYQVLAPRDEPQMAVVSALIRTMKRAELPEILQHPLLQAFIGRKWLNFNKIFYSLVIIYTCFVISLSWYAIGVVGENHNSTGIVGENYNGTRIVGQNRNSTGIVGENYNGTELEDKDRDSSENEYGDRRSTGPVDKKATKKSKSEWARRSIIFFACILFCHGLLQFLAEVKWYYCNFENLILFVSLMTSMAVALNGEMKGGDPPPWVSQVLSVAIPVAGIQMMLFLGRFPAWGYYALMLSIVLKHVLKVLFVGVFIIAGFSLSFFILFHNNTAFTEPWMAFSKTIMMMVGEYDSNSLFEDPPANDTMEHNSTSTHAMSNTFHPVIGRIVLITFLIITSIVLMNLMIGLAVSDVQALINEGQFGRLLKQAEFVSYCERITTSCFFRSALAPNFLKKWVNSTKINDQETISQTMPPPHHITKGVWRDIFLLCKKNREHKSGSMNTEPNSGNGVVDLAAIKTALAAMQSSQQTMMSQLQQLIQDREAEVKACAGRQDTVSIKEKNRK